MKNIYFIYIILLWILFMILLQIYKINNDIDNKYILYQCITYTVGFIFIFIFSINNIINKRNNLISLLFIILNSIFLLIYYNNIYIYNSSINIYLKNLPFLNTNFYNSYSGECGKIIKIKRVGEKYNNPCIYITNHSRKNPLNLIYCGALMNENLKIMIDSNTNFYNSFNEVKGCINIYSKTRNKYNYTKELLTDQVLNKLFSVIVFPNTNDVDVIKINNKYEISKIRSGVFKIAKEMNIPIKILVIKWPSILDNKTFLPKPETTLEIVYSDKVVNLDNIETSIEECKEEFIRVLSQ